MTPESGVVASTDAGSAAKLAMRIGLKWRSSFHGRLHVDFELATALCGIGAETRGKAAVDVCRPDTT
jgi:hypothetical protein